MGPSQLLPQHTSDPPGAAPKPTLTAVTLLCPAKGSCAEQTPVGICSSQAAQVMDQVQTHSCQSKKCRAREDFNR